MSTVGVSCARHVCRLLLRQQNSHCAGRRRCLAAVASKGDTFLHRDLSIRLASLDERQKRPDSKSQLIFGANFSDHMLEVEWHEDEGWGRPKIVPLHMLKLHPGAKVLHYATALFEGMKAYRGVDGTIRLFRPDKNMSRMLATAKRSALPAFDTAELQKCIVELVRVDADWVPQSTDASLYIRPTYIGTDPTLGINYSRSAMLYVTIGPVGAYFPTGFKPIQLLADHQFIRAFPGGTGGYKMACIWKWHRDWDWLDICLDPDWTPSFSIHLVHENLNYAPTILIAKEAAKRDCQQVLWLYGEDEKLTEVGTMNIFNFLINEDGDRELVTPPLDDGIILPGVTRDSLLELTDKWTGFKVSQRYLTMAELEKAVDEGRRSDRPVQIGQKKSQMLEMFGSGTACIVCPVDRILHRRKDGTERLLHIPTMEQKDGLMKRMYDAITGIQSQQDAEEIKMSK